MALSCVLAVAALVALPARGEAITLSFDCVGGTSTLCNSIESAYDLEIDETGTDDVFFRILHTGIAMVDTGAVTHVYFDVPGSNPFSDSDTGYGISDSGAGVSFDYDSSPNNPYGGFQSAYESVANNIAAGVDPGQWVSFRFDLRGGFSFADVLSALTTNSLRVALAVESLDPRDSRFSYFENNPYSAPTNPTPVPEPASLILFGTGLAGIAGMARRRRKKA